MVPGKIERLCLKARQSIEERDWEKAKQAYLMALGLKSDSPDIHMGLATVYFQLRELTSAAHHFKEVTRLDPLRAGAYINLGAILNLLQQVDEAVVALRRGIQLDPQRVEGYYNLGLVYRRKGQFDLAIQAYREALRLNPRMADAYLNLGNLYVEKQQYRTAIQNYEEALKIRPDWDKALEAREHAREMSGSGEKPSSTPTQSTRPQGRTGRAPSGEIDKPVDPNLHGNLLIALSQAASEAEKVGRRFQQVLADELDEVIKELSSCLLYPDAPRSQLDACVTRFEQALEKVQMAQQHLELGVTHLQEAGKQFPEH
ncbi:MAG TPA: tetratricopeptide repeat protein [Gemmataceae bacterium]|nr:tetratricopeptide repeat protein [Gemmataceae bacterium]